VILLLSYTEYLERLSEPRSIVDVALVFVIVYTVLRLVRGTRAAPMAAGLLGFAALYWLAIWQRLATLEFILRSALLYVGVAVIVLFQTEIRQALISLGNRLRLPLWRSHRGQFGEGVYDEIVLAATTLASTKTGALIVIERGISLTNAAESGIRLDAELSYDLLVAIFNPTSPLHDGAVIVREHRIVAASCFLPLTLNPLLSKDLGTRHRAAIGITEVTDAVAIVVSEETGLISFVERGQIKRGLDATRLRAAIMQALLAPRQRRRVGRLGAETEREAEEAITT
jgi:diadenylate cyclase